MITNDKIIEIFCATDEFSKKYEEEIENMPLLSSEGKVRQRRAASMSDSEIMTILIMFHFGTFDNFKHYYLHFIKLHLWDKIMLRKRYIIECINHLLKDKGNLVHSRHRSINNFLMNLIAAISAYCFFDNKPEAIKGYCVEDNKQLTLF